MTRPADILLRLCAIGAALALAACSTVGPDFEPPQAQLPDAWRQPADPDSLTRAAYWWRQFQDPVLDALVEATYAQNLDLLAAGLRIVQARAALGVATGLRYPQQQTLSGDLARAYQSDTAFNDFALSFDVTWEMDIWGRYARNIESAQAALYASVASYDDILIALTAEVARNYIDYRTFQERILLARENIQIQQRVLEMTTVQYESGNVTELDVQQAGSQLYATQASLPRLQTGRVQARNAIAVLLGRFPEQVEALLDPGGAHPAGGRDMPGIGKADHDTYALVPTAPALHPAIDASLVARRPDLRVAEAQARSQNARIGVAKTDLYPQFVLFGSIGLGQTVPAGQAFTGTDAVKVAVGPGFSWNIFNYGRIRNQVRVEDARFQEALTRYNQTVLKAVQEVSSALEGYQYALQERDAMISTVESSVRAYRISMTQYQEGLVSYQRLLSTVETMTRSEDQYAQAKGSIANQLVALYKALGGGWQLRSGRPFVPAAVRRQMHERSDWGHYLEPAGEDAP